MAFDFLGTIESLDDFEELEEFVTVEMTKIGAKINHLTQEVQRFSFLLDRFKVADLKLRADYKQSDQADADWVTQARPVELLKIKQLDGMNAIDVDTLKVSVLDQIKFKRERNEFKILRIRDLMEQFNNEIAFLQARQTDYTDYITRIRDRFELPDYTELTKTAPLDPADIANIKVIPENAGRQIVNGITYYQVLSINGAFGTVTFNYTAPPVQYGDQITISSATNNGNNGVKTIREYKDSRTLYVVENMVTESPSTGLVIINSSS